MGREKNYFVLKLEGYEGEDTFLRCGDEKQNHLFSVVVLTKDGRLSIADNGYRTPEEACAAWPEAITPPEAIKKASRK